MKNVKDYNKTLNEAKKVRPEEIEDYFTNINSGKMLDKIFKGKFDEEKFRNYLGDILDRTKRIESVIKIWSGYFGLNPKDYTSGEFIEDIMFLDDITIAAKEAYETFVNQYVNEGKINFNDSPFKKALPIKQVAELIKKASKEDVDKLLKTLTIKQVKDMEGMKKGGGSDVDSLAAILTDEKGQYRVHWLKNRLSEYVNEGKLKFSEIKKGDFLKKRKRNIELEVLDVSVGKPGFDDSVTLYNDVTGYKTEIVDLGEYTLVEASEDFAGWVAIYNGKRIEIDKSEADGIYQAKQIAIKKLKVPKSKVGLLAIAPGYNESMYEGKNDYSARFGKTDITIKNGHKLTDEDSLYDMYEKIGKVIKDSGLDLGSVIIKESQSLHEERGEVTDDMVDIVNSINKKGKKITDYVTALGTVVAQVMADHPKLGKYHEMKGKRGFIKLQQLKDLPEKELIALANSL